MKDLVTKQYLPPGKQYNRPLTALTPQGLALHETDTPGATAQNERDYFAGGYRGGSAHYFVDSDATIQAIPENEQAWHAGPTANKTMLSIEMCRPASHDPAYFARVWDRTVDLAADICVRYGWNTDPVWSHDGISKRWGETDHTDPIEYLAEYGRTWQNLLNAIDAKIQETKGWDTPMKEAILIWSWDDSSGAKQIADRLGNCGIFCRNGVADAIHPDAKGAQHLIVVGGPAVSGHPNVTNLCGDTGPHTAILSAQYAQTL